MWTNGKIGEYTFYIKHYEEGSEYGINNGRISKLEIRKGNQILANYDRGWDKKVEREAIPAFKEILSKYN